MLVAAACGSDDDSSAAGSGNGSGGGGDVEEVSIVLLAETAGESSFAIPNFADGVAMAIDDVRDDGGIAGASVEYERFALPPTDVAEAKTVFRQGLDADPTVLIGFPSSDAIKALAQDVKAAGVPTLSFFGDPSVFYGAPDSVDAENLFIIRPNNAAVGTDIGEYAVEEMGYERVALLCVDGPTGEVGCDQAAAAVEAGGGEVVARERHGTTDTDLTAQVQAIGSQNPDVVLTFPFPNQLGIFVNQMADNGFDVPVIGGVAQGMMIDAGVITGAQAALMTGFDDCSPVADPREEVQEWAERYEERFGYRPNWASAQAYDSVMFAKAAIEQAGTTDHEAVIEAISEVEYEGMCGPLWKADVGHGLIHNQDVITWNDEDEPELLQRNVLPPNAFE